MDPKVGGELDARHWRHSLVEGAVVCAVGIRVKDARPEHGTPALGPHLKSEVVEARVASLLHVGEVHEEGEQAHAPAGIRQRVLVVVRLVELPGFVPEHLQVLRVLPGYAHHVGYALAHLLQRNVVEAEGHVAPRRGGGAHGRHTVAREGALKVVAALGNERVHLVGGKEVVELQHPGVPRQGRGAHRPCGVAEAPEHGVQPAGAHRGRCVLGAHAPLLRDEATRAAGEGAFLQHKGRVGEALAVAPGGAVREMVVALR
mmetsp:Transcript_1526/g.4448  ORF Transcript_1526/g.4448 Transcript_1526/m.4448 type:complete len:259 (+) Transcript_1526:228-1004(+)